MSSEPLQPFSPPASFEHYLPAALSSGELFTWFLYFIFALWALYTIVAVYHWLKYSHGSLIAFPAIGIHMFASFSLMAYALTGSLPYF
jgi:hypothetical protein